MAKQMLIIKEESYSFLDGDIAVLADIGESTVAAVEAKDIIKAIQLAALPLSDQRIHHIMHNGTQKFGTTIWHFTSRDYTIVDDGER